MRASIDCSDCIERRIYRQRQPPRGLLSFGLANFVVVLLTCSLAFVSGASGSATNQSADNRASYRLLQSPATNATGTEAPANSSANATTSSATTTAPSVPSTTAPVPATTNPAAYTTFGTELPPSVDVSACRKHLQVVDKDRNNVLTEDEYVNWIREIVTKDFNHSLSENPNDPDIWAGKTVPELPVPVQTNYHNLTQGGYIDVVGYRPSQEAALAPTLAQKLFLVKVCVNTETAVYQVFRTQQESGAGAGATVVVPDEVQVLDVYSSFELSNAVGITAENLESDTSSNKKQLELAYATLVTQVVSAIVGMELTRPTESATAGKSSSASSTSGRDATLRGRRRRMTVALDPLLPEITNVDDIPCPGAPANQTASLQTKWCQRAYAKFLLYLVGQDRQAIFDEYSQAVQTAIGNGDLQTVFQDVTSDASDLTVTGAGPSIFTPVPTPGPTQAPVSPPTLAPANITVPEPQVNITSTPDDGGGVDMGLLVILACVLGSFNCLIITVSIYECYRNKKYSEEDDDDENVSAQWSEHNKTKKTKLKPPSQRSGLSGEESFYDEEDSARMSSPAPTLEDIADANRMPEPAPAPAPVPAMLTQEEMDAQERERILEGQGGSTQSAVSAEEPLTSIGEVDEEESKAFAPPPAADTTASAGYEEEEKLPVDQGELA